MMTQEDLLIALRLTFRGIQLSWLTYNFLSHLIVNLPILNSLQTQCFSAFAKLKTYEICRGQFSRNLSPTKIQDNKEVAGASRFADKCAMNKTTEKMGGRTSSLARSRVLNLSNIFFIEMLRKKLSQTRQTANASNPLLKKLKKPVTKNLHF